MFFVLSCSLPLLAVLCCAVCCPCSNLTRELLDYLAVCDSEFKPDLTAKIAALITRFAPDRRWHFDNLLSVLVQVRGVGWQWQWDCWLDRGHV
jgi:hypothetical protein